MNDFTDEPIKIQTEFPLEYEEGADEEVAKIISDNIKKMPRLSRREMNHQLGYWRRMEYKQRRSAFRSALKKRPAPLSNHQHTKRYKQRLAFDIAKSVITTDAAA